MSGMIKPSPPPPKRTETLTLRLTSTEKQKLDQLARRLGRSTAAIGRDFLFQAIALFEQQEGARNAE